MRITGLSIQSFGQLRDLTLGGLDADIVCFSGPNEIGKTTVFDFIGAMLYGIYPVTLENHPYAPRDAGVISGELTYRLADGGGGRISRRLRSSPDGEWTKGDGLFAHPQQIKNRTLPVVDHITETVFRDVYALSLLDLKRFETSAFQEIEERLLGGLNSAHVRPARVVAEELHLAASRIWRKDNRGKPRARALEVQKRDLSKELRHARRTANELRQISEQLDSIDEQLATLVPKRESLRQALADASAARAAADRSRSTEALRAAADRVLPYDDVPGDPVALLEQFRAEIREVDDRIEAVRTSVREVERSATRKWPVHRVYQNRASIRSACQDLRMVLSEVDSSEACNGELPMRIAGFEAAVRNLVHADDTRDNLEFFARIDRGLIADAVDEGRSLNTEMRRLGVDSARVVARSRFAGQAALLLTTTSILVWAFGPGILVGLSVILATSAIAVALRSLVVSEQLRRQREYVVDRAGEVLRRLALLAGGRPVRTNTSAGDVPDDVDVLDYVVRFGSELDRLVVEARELHRLSGLKRTLETRRAEADAAVRRIAKAVDADLDSDGVAEVELIAETLLTWVAESETIVRNESERVSLLAEYHEELRRLDIRRSSTLSREQSLTSRLEQLGDGEFMAGVAALSAGRSARDELVRLVDLDEATEAKADAAFVEGGEGANNINEPELRREEAEVESRIQDLNTERSELQVAHLDLAKHRTVDDVEGELESVADELRAAHMRHDVLRLMESIVRRADERFRDKHQPDVVARANEMLALITDGKYHRLVFDEKTLDVKIVQAGDRTPRAIDKSVSQGTRDQVYLALRLALAEHMDEAHEAIPVFLDEVFVTWDHQRRKRFYPILADMSKRRQIFLLTCHGWFEEEALVELGAHVVSLDRIPNADPSLQMRAL